MSCIPEETPNQLSQQATPISYSNQNNDSNHLQSFDFMRIQSPPPIFIDSPPRQGQKNE